MKERFDVVNKNRKPLNYTKERGEKLNEDEYNTGVESWIISDNKILMTKRSKLKSHPGQWEVPGGCSQAGENSWETLIREISEEVNLTVTPDNTEFIDTQLYKKQFVDIYQSNINIDLKKIKLQEEEVSDIKLINKEEFNKLIENNKIVPSVLDRYNLIKEKLKLDW